MAIKPVPGYGAKAAMGPPSLPKKVVVPKIPNAAKAPIGSIKGSVGVLPGYAAAVKNFTPTPLTQAAIAGMGGTAQNMPSVMGGTTPQTAGPEQQQVPFNYGAYLNEIENDPVFKAQQEKLGTDMNSWRRQLESAIRGGVVGGGWDIQSGVANDPLLKEYLNKYISPEMWGEINAAASGNQLSDKAQLERKFQEQTRASLYEQAARGTLGSGSQAVAQTNLNDASTLAANTAQNQLLQALRGNVGDYLTNVQTGQQGLESTRGEVAARLAAQEGATYGMTDYDEAGNEEGDQTVTGTGPNGPSSAASTLGGQGVKWGGQVFTTAAAMANYLKQQGNGVTYAQWAQNHPDAAARLR